MSDKANSLTVKKIQTELNLKVGVLYNFCEVYKYHFDSSGWYEPAWDNYLIRCRYVDKEPQYGVYIGEDLDRYVFQSIKRNAPKWHSDHIYIQKSPYKMDISEGDIVIPKSLVLGAKFVRKGFNDLHDRYEYSTHVECMDDEELSSYYVFRTEGQNMVPATQSEVCEYINVEYIKSYDNIQLIMLPNENSNVCKTSQFNLKTSDIKIGLKGIEVEGTPTITVNDLKNCKTTSCQNTLTIVLEGVDVVE